jgi:hypothetical protein
MLIRGSEAAFIVIVPLSQSITGLFCVGQGFRRVGVKSINPSGVAFIPVQATTDRH